MPSMLKTFEKGTPALPPAEKHAVGRFTCFQDSGPPDIGPLQSPAWTPESIPQQPIESTLATPMSSAMQEAMLATPLRSLVISEQLLGTNGILLFKPTGCGMLTFKDQDAQAVVEKILGAVAQQELLSLDFQPSPDPDKAVEDDVEYLEASKAISDTVTISGWGYEIEIEKVKQVL